MTKRTKVPEPDRYPMTLETFRDPWYALSNSKQDDPMCFNDLASVTRFRITVERIIEPKEVIAARIQKLWDASKNDHDIDPLRAAAAKIGYSIQGSWGHLR